MLCEMGAMRRYPCELTEWQTIKMMKYRFQARRQVFERVTHMAVVGQRDAFMRDGGGW